MLLFKNGFMKFIKDYVQFIIFILLILLSVVFTSTFGISASNLIRTKDRITQNYVPYDYSFRYTTSGYDANDVQTLNPWFAFNLDVLSANQTSYATLIIGANDAVLKPYEFKIAKNQKGEFTYDSAIYEIYGTYYVNFGFGDTESKYDPANIRPYQPSQGEVVSRFNLQQKLAIVQSGEFGRFYRFNFENAAFKNSLFGQLYQKFNYFQGNLSTSDLTVASNLFDYMFYVNNSAITSTIKNVIAQIYKVEQDATIVETRINFQSAENEPESLEEIKTKGFNGRIGRVFTSLDEDSAKSQYYLADRSTIAEVFDNKNQRSYGIEQLYKNGTYAIKDFEARNLFWSPQEPAGFIIDQKNITSRNLFETYFKILGNLTNFTVELTSEVVMWNKEGQKFRFISSFYNTTTITSNNQKIDETHFYYPESYTIYDQLQGNDVLTRNSFMASSGWVEENQWELGKIYKIFPEFNTKADEFRLDAIGTDYYNTYPTIYEEDLISNQSNEAVFYTNSITFEKYFNYLESRAPLVPSSNYQDVSRTYMRYFGEQNSLVDNVKLFQLYLADNMVTLPDAIEALTTNTFNDDLRYARANLEAKDATSTLALRSELIMTVSSLFLAILIIFCLIFMLCIAFMIYTIVKKVMVSQRGQIGNLKSLGYSNGKILINYLAYMGLPLLVIVPIGWALSIFLQTPVMKVFENYFNIPVLFTIDWQILIFLLLGFLILNTIVVGIVAYATIRQNPLALLAPSKSHQPNLTLTRLIYKFKYQRFTSKLRMILVSTSVSSLFTFLGVITFSSLILTFASILPSSMTKMKEEYFTRIDYNNDYSYANQVTNNPLTRPAFYQVTADRQASNAAVSIFNTYVKRNLSETSGSAYYNLLADAEVLGNQYFAQSFEDVVYNNLLTFKGITISPQTLHDVIAAGNLASPEAGKAVTTTVNNFACQVLPTLFAQEPISGIDNVDGCIKNISNNILPSTIKQLWEADETNYLNFAFNFGAIPVNLDFDELYTRLQANDFKSGLNLEGFGLDLTRTDHQIQFSNLQTIKYQSNLDYIPVLINEKLKVRGYQVGQEFTIKTPTNKLAVKEIDKSQFLDTSAWSYKVNGKSIDLATMKLDKFSYLIPDAEQEGGFYYRDEAGDMVEYYNLKDITLQLDVKNVDVELLNKVNNDYEAYSGQKLAADSNGILTVNPFDIYTYEDNRHVPIDLFQIAMTGTNSWLNIALKEGLLHNQIFEEESKPLKIVGIEKVYNGDRFFMDQIYANEFLGYQEPETRQIFADGSSINIYSNAKLSASAVATDHFENYLLTPSNMNNTTDGFAAFMKPTIGQTDFIKIREAAVEDLIASTLAIVIVLILICIITSIIVIYLMTDMFVGHYKTFMSYMRIQGYFMKEINSVVMWIFLPLTLVGAALGIGIVLLTLYTIVPAALLILNVAVGFLLNWWLLPMVLVLTILIFGISYTIILKSLANVQLAKILG
ncbi:hypothetical protein SCLARK_001662 [Spiroplasma clarkii]|uniref:ABC transporter permease n=1 Tax=Spiroplasma clarkii TaxID=2139 RepID=A0A1Y0L2Z1_9MOLU|nr:FtsX-like permease family protein [Spiroplasma clarkii]ARU92130.1 hypothetical protein SCLARK_001662 [Spiroplasma clarkii]ATX71466.1 ABC transporter permease [Spiroplasma clarkii]